METRGKEKRQAFHLVPVERTAEELYTAGLDQQEIDAFVQANLDEINADIETHNKKKPKMGAKIAAYKEAKDKWQAVSDDLGARLDYYRILQEHIKDMTTRESETIGNSSEVLQGEESVSAPGIESVGERNEGREVTSDVQGGTETAAAQTETEQVSQPVGDADNLGGSEIPNNEPVNEEGIGGAPSLLDVVRILYSKGKKVASKLFSMKFFDVAQTPKFMQELGLDGDKFTIKYGVIARHIGKDNSHTLSEKDWEQLPQALQNPLLYPN